MLDVDYDGHRCFFPIYNTRMDFSPIQSVKWDGESAFFYIRKKYYNEYIF